MKSLKNIFFILCSFSMLCLTAQENDPGWLWAERGGSASGFNYSGPLYDYHEERIIDLAVDSENNYYYLAAVAGYNFTIGNIQFDTYNDSASSGDILLFSTDEEGYYRWSKIMGGGGDDNGISINTDNEDNIYVSGSAFTLPNHTPFHFDNDTIKEPGSFFDPGPHNKAAFIIKYDSAGEYQWLVMPGDDEAYLSAEYGYGNAYVVKSIIDENDILHNLIWFKSGNHFDGELIVEEGDYVAAIVKYDSSGNLIDFFTLEMTPLALFYNYQLAYDANLDRYYIADTRRALNDNILGIGDYGSDHSGFYLAAIDNQGNVLWFHQNETSSLYAAGDLQLDSQGNIYFSGRFQSDSAEDSFAGYVFEMGNNYTIQNPFLIKLDSDGNLIWGTNALLYSPYPGNSIVIDGNDIYVGFGSLNNTWGGIEIPHPPGTGLTPDIAIMRFNAQTGEAQELIYDQPAMSHDAITKMALDQNGDLVVGGYFGSDLFYGTDLHLHNNGADSDFFIAKYQTEKTVDPCPTPTAIVIEELAAESVQLSWTPGADENQWEVVYGTPGFDPETAENVLIVNIPEATLENLAPETDYIVYVRAICEEENHSDWSASVSFTTKELSTENQQMKNLSIYPNPTTGVLNISGEINLKSYQLYDLQGRLIQAAELTQPQIDLSKIERGLYFLQIENQQGIVKNLKVVKK